MADIITSDRGRFNSLCNTGWGDISFDEFGRATVSDEVAEAIVDSDDFVFHADDIDERDRLSTLPSTVLVEELFKLGVPVSITTKLSNEDLISLHISLNSREVRSPRGRKPKQNGVSQSNPSQSKVAPQGRPPTKSRNDE